MLKRKIKVVLDTNIFVSAIVFGGIPREIIKLQAQKKIIVFISPFIIEEVTRILGKKFHFSHKYLIRLQERLEKSTKMVISQKKINLIKIDDTDNRILECAKEAKANFIISGDRRHILPLKKFGKTRIVSATEFLKILEKN